MMTAGGPSRSTGGFRSGHSTPQRQDIQRHCRALPGIADQCPLFWVNCLNSSRLMEQLVYVQPAVREANHERQ